MASCSCSGNCFRYGSCAGPEHPFVLPHGNWEMYPQPTGRIVDLGPRTAAEAYDQALSNALIRIDQLEEHDARERSFEKDAEIYSNMVTELEERVAELDLRLALALSWQEAQLKRLLDENDSRNYPGRC